MSATQATQISQAKSGTVVISRENPLFWLSENELRCVLDEMIAAHNSALNAYNCGDKIFIPYSDVVFYDPAKHQLTQPRLVVFFTEAKKLHEQIVTILASKQKQKARADTRVGLARQERLFSTHIYRLYVEADGRAREAQA